MMSLIIEKLENHVVKSDVSVRYKLAEDQKGYYFYFPSFSYENKVVSISVSMMSKKIESVSSINQMKSKYGWRHLFYLWVKTKDRSVRLDVSDCSCYKDLEKMGNIAKRLGSIFNLNFVTELDIDRPTTGTYNIELKPEEIEHIDNKEETDGTYNIELKPKEIEHIANKEETESTLSNNSAGSKDSFDEEDNIDVQSLLNEKLADIATYIEKNEKINKNKEFIKIKLIEVFSNLSEYKLDILVRQCMYYLESFDLEAQFYLSEVECAWTVIKEKCPTADYNDSYIFRAFISYLDLSLTLDPTKKDKLI